MIIIKHSYFVLVMEPTAISYSHSCHSHKKQASWSFTHQNCISAASPFSFHRFISRTNTPTQFDIHLSITPHQHSKASLCGQVLSKTTYSHSAPSSQLLGSLIPSFSFSHLTSDQNMLFSHGSWPPPHQFMLCSTTSTSEYQK